jgi:peptidoglycan hydrolase-like protein with peptidoglycan-binding domain
MMAIPTTISQGSQGPIVRWAQYLLVRRTLSYPQIDGVFGPVTKHAVEQFQASEALTADGIVGPITWKELGGDGAEPPTLSNGAQGPVVRALQNLLNEGRGDFAPATNPVLAVDGIYGPQTTTAVRGAQQSGGITTDGITGLQTWALPVHADGQTIADLCGVRGPGTS